MPVKDKRTDIFNCGRELFGCRGFKKTGVSGITKMAGVAVGTFYRYYASKEQLFIEIYIRENEELKKRIMESVDPSDEPVKMIAKIMELNLSGINSNPILGEWRDKDLFGRLNRQFCAQGGVGSIGRPVNNGAIELIKMLKSGGRIRNDLDDDYTLAFFNTLSCIEIHKEEIGVRHFPQIINYLTEFIAKGLVSPNRQIPILSPE
jgi:AcrR family transcriptional regulator